MTDNRTTELLPCPFCGGEAETVGDDCMEWIVECVECCASSMAFSTEAEAIAAWNTRAYYHGYEQAAIEAWKSIKTWNTRAELGSGTCEWQLEHSGTLYDKWRCSKCGYLYVASRTDGGATDFAPNFCPNCGRKVVDA